MSTDARPVYKARRTAPSVLCAKCGREYTRTLAGKGRCRACVEEEAAEFRELHCASCGLEKKDEIECVYSRSFHLGTFDVNPESEFWDNWTDQNGQPDSDRCKAEYGKEGGYIWSGCGCNVGPEKEDDCEVRFDCHADWPEDHPLNCAECDEKKYYCQRDTEQYKRDQMGYYDADYGEGDDAEYMDEGDEGENEGDEGDYLDYGGDEGDERAAGYDGEEETEDEPDDAAGLSPDEAEEEEGKAVVQTKPASALLGGSNASVRAIWLFNKGGNTHFDEDEPANTLPEIVKNAQYSAGAANSPFVEKTVSVTKLPEWCAAQGYQEFPTPLCTHFGLSLRCFARNPERASARAPINVVATHLTGVSIDQLNAPLFGRALLVRYDANGNPVDLPREELIRLLSFVNDIYQMFFDSLAPTPELFASWKVCFDYYDPASGDQLLQHEMKGQEERYMNGATGERKNMEVVHYQTRLREREAKTSCSSSGEETAVTLAGLANMSLQESKTQGAAAVDESDDTVKFHTGQDASPPLPTTSFTAETPASLPEEKSVFPSKGARCVIRGLKKKPTLNGRKGEIVGAAAGGRWTIQVVKDDGSPDGETHDLLPANFTQDVTSFSSAASSASSPSAAPSNSVRVAELAPTSASTPSASIPLTVLAFPVVDRGLLESEKAFLKSTKGWKQPQTLEAYSVRSDYRDLTAYYDAEDETSPLNELAQKTFCGYKKVPIRGSVVITRADPPLSLNFGESPFGSGPMPSAFATPGSKPEVNFDELRETLVFYTANDVRKVAQERDFQRTSSSFKQMQS